MAGDDWMNPTTTLSFTAAPTKDGTYYQIQRKRATPVSGNVSRIYSWDVWREYREKEERDVELRRLREANPEWHLRARAVTYFHGQLITSGDPFEYRDA